MVVLVVRALTVRFNVAIESQPTAFTKVSLYVPAVLNVFPFHVKGNCDEHILESVVLKLIGLTVILKVAVVSHCPAAGVNVYTVVPGVEVLIVEFHVPVTGGVLLDEVGNTGGVEF